MQSPVCATSTAREVSSLTNISFEMLLSRLPSESRGLSQNELFSLFCRKVREFFGASEVCCCHASRQGDWCILSTSGHSPWGAQGETASPIAAEWLSQAERIQKAILCQRPSPDSPQVQRTSGSSQIAVPFLSQDEVLGAALAAWPDMTEVSQETLERLTLLGVSFGGLLDQARLFEQVHSSRERWVRVIDAIPDAIVVHNTEGNSVEANWAPNPRSARDRA